jgi:hypothetical protein
MSGYLSLFSVSLQHSYFAQGVASALALAPGPASAATLLNYGMRFRPAPGGGAVYYGDQARLAGYASAAPLVFYVTNSDPALLNYTAIASGGLDLAGAIFYFDNLAGGGALGPALADSALPWLTGLATIALPAPVTSAGLSVKDHLRGEVLWQGQSPPAPASVVTLDLRALPPGRYQLAVNGSAVQDFFLGEGGKPFAAIALYPGGALQCAYLPAGAAAFDADGQPCGAAYTLALQARQTLWRYIVFEDPRQGQSLDGWTVLGQGGATRIEFACTPPAQAGQPWTYTSPQPLALAQTPGAMSFSLQPGPSAGHASAAVRLPYAQGTLLVLPDASSPQGGFSDIYVYL